jgi:hypothetical protein
MRYSCAAGTFAGVNFGVTYEVSTGRLHAVHFIPPLKERNRP